MPLRPITHEDLDKYPFPATAFGDGRNGYAFQSYYCAALDVMVTAERAEHGAKWVQTFTWNGEKFDTWQALIDAMNAAGFELPPVPGEEDGP